MPPAVCALQVHRRLEWPQRVCLPPVATALSVAWFCCLWAVSGSAEDAAPVLSLQRPMPYEVVQREGFVPQRAATNTRRVERL